MVCSGWMAGADSGVGDQSTSWCCGTRCEPPPPFDNEVSRPSPTLAPRALVHILLLPYHQSDQRQSHSRVRWKVMQLRGDSNMFVLLYSQSYLYIANMQRKMVYSMTRPFHSTASTINLTQKLEPRISIQTTGPHCHLWPPRIFQNHAAEAEA